MSDLADEIVEAAVGGGQFLEAPDQESAGSGSPQQQREMGEVAALGEDVEGFCHGTSPSAEATAGGGASPPATGS